jgi:hypothetical protein
LSVFLATLKGMKSLRRIQNSIFVLGAVAALMTGCGRSNTVYSDPANAAAGPTGTDSRSLFPEGFFDQSLGDASVEIVNAGTQQAALRLKTESAGSRAILGVSNYDQLPLADFDGLEFEGSTSASLRVSLLIDLACDHSESLVTINADGVQSEIGRGDVSWRQTGSNQTFSLESFSNQYPNACLRNGESTDSDLPRMPLASLLLSVGDTQAPHSIEIKSLTIQNDTFENWGSK